MVISGIDVIFHGSIKMLTKWNTKWYLHGVLLNDTDQQVVCQNTGNCIILTTSLLLGNTGFGKLLNWYIMVTPIYTLHGINEKLLVDTQCIDIIRHCCRFSVESSPGDPIFVVRDIVQIVSSGSCRMFMSHLPSKGVAWITMISS